ncbi:hypothetical protein KI387_037817, partial [Taxus chinensis]
MAPTNPSSHLGLPEHPFPTPTGVTPYSLVFGKKSIIPLEIELPSLRISLQDYLDKDEDYRVARLAELELLDE